MLWEMQKRKPYVRIFSLDVGLPNSCLGEYFGLLGILFWNPWEYFFGIPALGILSEKLGCLVIPPCLRRGEHTAKKEVFKMFITGDLRIRRKGK